MSDPQRYTLALPEISYGMDESNKGEYVLWRDYKRLKAEVGELCEAIKLASEVGIKMADEVTRLKAENERLKIYDVEHWQDQWLLVVEDNNKLRAEVERLTKAHSDALADFWAIHKGYFDLKAEVERLRKAGDNLITALDKRDDVFDNSDKRQAIADWNAAKEGRPNE